jgi:hypothetical protein
MKKLLILFGFIFSLLHMAYSHKQHVHQYIVREAINLLQLQKGSIPKLANHISTLEGSGGGNWASGLITAGAWNEDEEDIIYGKTGDETSVSHFWDPDDGDDPDVSLKINIGGLTETTVSAPNAYQKLKKFESGYFIINPGIEYCFKTEDGHKAKLINEGTGQSITSFSYHSLIEITGSMDGQMETSQIPKLYHL